MAISTKKRNAIVAMWKTGEFKSFTSIAKHYKISTKTAQKIIGANTHVHEDIVEAGVNYELAKKSTKNPHDINSIEKVVQGRIDTIAIDNDLVSNNRKLAKAFQGLIGKKVRDGEYKTPQDIKAGTSTIKDIESIANPHVPKTEINNTNAQQNVVGFEFKEI